MKKLPPSQPSPCSCAITVSEVAGALGSIDETVLTLAERLGGSTTADWCGRPAFAVADAGRLYAAVRGDWDEHAARWAEYQRYLEERREATRREQQAAIEAEREAERQRSVSSPGEARSPRRRRRHVPPIDAARVAAAQRGNPEAFEDFAKKRAKAPVE